MLLTRSGKPLHPNPHNATTKYTTDKAQNKTFMNDKFLEILTKIAFLIY